MYVHIYVSFVNVDLPIIPLTFLNYSQYIDII